MPIKVKSPLDFLPCFQIKQTLAILSWEGERAESQARVGAREINKKIIFVHSISATCCLILEQPFLAGEVPGNWALQGKATSVGEGSQQEHTIPAGLRQHRVPKAHARLQTETQRLRALTQRKTYLSNVHISELHLKKWKKSILDKGA